MYLSHIAKCPCLKLQNVFVSKCKMSLSKIAKCICLKLQNVFVLNIKIFIKCWCFQGQEEKETEGINEVGGRERAAVSYKCTSNPRNRTMRFYWLKNTVFCKVTLVIEQSMNTCVFFSKWVSEWVSTAKNYEGWKYLRRPFKLCFESPLVFVSCLCWNLSGERHSIRRKWNSKLSEYK